MKPNPPPNGSLLPQGHQALLGEFMSRLLENEFEIGKLRPLLPGMVDRLSEACGNDDDFGEWCQEVERWIAWYRMPAYWLAYLLQGATQQRRSPHHVVACVLFADAQALFADDFSLLSLETAYLSCAKIQTAIGSESAVDGVARAVRSRLQVHYDYYHRWSSPFEYKAGNPCADHLYFSLTRAQLAAAVRTTDPDFQVDEIGDLERVIAQCTNDDSSYHRILARRMLGLLHGGRGNPEASLAQYELAWADASRLRLDTEIGHLHRLVGCSLRAVGRVEEARHRFEQSLSYELLKPWANHTTYWQALSARELGDTLLRCSSGTGSAPAAPPGGPRVVVGENEIRLALKAYHDGRLYFSGHLTAQSRFPVARAAKQQLFRSFSANAVAAASAVGSLPDLVAEIEGNGPRQMTEVATEMAAAAASGQRLLPEFRRARSAVYRSLSTMPPNFDEYIANLALFNDEKRSYQQQLFSLDQRLIKQQWSDRAVDEVLALQIPKTVFLLFHLATDAGVMVMLDLGSSVAAPIPMAFGENRLRAIHDRYVEDLTIDVAGALDRLLESYQELFGPLLDPLLPHLLGKHLKIFPRLQMNAVPWHALSVKGKALIDHCAEISYGQTLALFLENHRPASRPSDRPLRIVLGDEVPLYDLLLPRMREVTAAGLIEDRPKSWDELLASIAERPSHDLFFACHGNYVADRLEGGWLQFQGESPGGRVSFSAVFGDLDLRSCRSVIMGACESGLARSNSASEYIGLPSAMLASGAQYVLGALWTIPQAATAALTIRLIELLSQGAGVCAALCCAQRAIRGMKRDELAAWFSSLLSPGEDLDAILEGVAEMEKYPLAHPYHWAGFQAVGDI